LYKFPAQHRAKKLFLSLPTRCMHFLPHLCTIKQGRLFSHTRAGRPSVLLTSFLGTPMYIKKPRFLTILTKPQPYPQKFLFRIFSCLKLRFPTYTAATVILPQAVVGNQERGASMRPHSTPRLYTRGHTIKSCAFTHSCVRCHYFKGVHSSAPQYAPLYR